MPTVMETELAASLAATVEQLQAQIAEFSKRVAVLERNASASGTSASGTTVMAGPPAAAPQLCAEPAAAITADITEEELVAISAAIGAYLGVRAHIRQIRLLTNSAWAQQGRVSIQASHRLQG